MQIVKETANDTSEVAEGTGTSASPEVADLVFDDIYRRYKGRLTDYAQKRQAADPEAVADLALLDGYRALRRSETQTDRGLRRYLFIAVGNHMKNEARKPVPEPMVTDDGNVEPWAGFESELVESLHIRELIDQLPSAQRAVVTHRYIDGLSAKETGRLLGKDPNAIYQLQHRATRRLHRLILAGAVLLLLVAAVAILARQAERQVIDSSPADTDQQLQTDQVPTTTANNLEPDRTSGAVADDDESASAAIVADDADLATSPAEAPVTPTSTTPAAAAFQPPETVDDQASTAPVSTAEPVTPSTVDPLLQVVANDDTIRVGTDQAIDYDVLANDGPSIVFGTVTRTSSLLGSVSLSAGGRLTGSISEAGDYYIMYRLDGTNGTTDLGQIHIIVE